MVNIIVVFRKLDDAKNIRRVLQRHGFTVTACCSTGVQAIGLFDDLKNGIVICGYQLMDMLYTGPTPGSTWKSIACPASW